MRPRRERPAGAERRFFPPDFMPALYNRGHERCAFMKTRAAFAVGILLVLVLSFLAWTQMYKWQDEKTVTHFSGAPPPGKGAVMTKVGEPEGAPERAKDLREPAGRKMAASRSYGDIQVVMYMTDWCGYCRKAREYLQSLGVNLVEYDIEKDRAKREEFQKKGGRGVPLIDVEGIIIKGFSQKPIRDAVEKRKSRP